jgi:hypothetical protein
MFIHYFQLIVDYFSFLVFLMFEIALHLLLFERFFLYCMLFDHYIYFDFYFNIIHDLNQYFILKLLK